MEWLIYQTEDWTSLHVLHIPRAQYAHTHTLRALAYVEYTCLSCKHILWLAGAANWNWRRLNQKGTWYVCIKRKKGARYTQQQDEMRDVWKFSLCTTLIPLTHTHTFGNCCSIETFAKFFLINNILLVTGYAFLLSVTLRSATLPIRQPKRSTHTNTHTMANDSFRTHFSIPTN